MTETKQVKFDHSAWKSRLVILFQWVLILLWYIWLKFLSKKNMLQGRKNFFWRRYKCVPSEEFKPNIIL